MIVRMKLFGCCACRIDKGRFTQPFPPANAHHFTIPHNDNFVIGLCHKHHGRDVPGSIHNAKRTFVKTYGDPWEMYFMALLVMERLDIYHGELEATFDKYETESRNPTLAFQDARKRYNSFRAKVITDAG